MPKIKQTSFEITDQLIVDRVRIIRGIKVMLDKDLAAMYGVQTSVLNQAVKRNNSRFPDDFMFQLSQKEFESLISQSVISKQTGRGGTRKLPYAFTEHGVAMISGVLGSETAIQVNLQIIRVFIKMKQLLLDNKDLYLKIEKIENKLTANDEDIQNIFSILKKLLQPPAPLKRKEIGFPYPNKK